MAQACGAGLLAGYADVLADPGPAVLRGYLTEASTPCYACASMTTCAIVVDYKTNRLGGYDEPLTA